MEGKLLASGLYWEKRWGIYKQTPPVPTKHTGLLILWRQWVGSYWKKSSNKMVHFGAVEAPWYIKDAHQHHIQLPEDICHVTTLFGLPLISSNSPLRIIQCIHKPSQKKNHFKALTKAKNFRVILKLWSYEVGLPSVVLPRNWDSHKQCNVLSNGVFGKQLNN